MQKSTQNQSKIESIQFESNQFQSRKPQIKTTFKEENKISLKNKLSSMSDNQTPLKGYFHLKKTPQDLQEFGNSNPLGLYNYPIKNNSKYQKNEKEIQKKGIELPKKITSISKVNSLFNSNINSKFKELKNESPQTKSKLISDKFRKLNNEESSSKMHKNELFKLNFPQSNYYSEKVAKPIDQIDFYEPSNSLMRPLKNRLKTEIKTLEKDKKNELESENEKHEQIIKFENNEKIQKYKFQKRNDEIFNKKLTDEKIHTKKATEDQFEGQIKKNKDDKIDTYNEKNEQHKLEIQTEKIGIEVENSLKNIKKNDGLKNKKRQNNSSVPTNKELASGIQDVHAIRSWIIKKHQNMYRQFSIKYRKISNEK